MPQARHHYTECGLDNVYLVNGFRRTRTPRGLLVAIEDIDGLHRAIGQSLVHRKKRLSPREIRFLRHEMGLSQTNLGAMLGVTDQSVARWEKGQVKPGAEERMLRVLYEEHIGGNERLTDILRKLADLDEMADELEMTFEPPGGWETTHAA